MSRENLPLEKFFLLRKGIGNTTLWGMDSPDKIHDRFFNLLTKKKDSYGRGFNKFLHHETGLSTSYLSLLLAGKKRASQNTQMLISKALNFDYQNILLPEKPVKPAPTPNSNLVEYKTLTEKKHFEVIQTFEDPEYALMLNTYLAELERLDVVAYERIGAEVRGLVRDIKRKKREEEQKQASDQAPDEKEA